MLHGDKVLGKMMPEIIRKTYYMLLSSKESIEKNQMASVYWKILDTLQKKRDEFRGELAFFCKQILKGITCSETLGLKVLEKSIVSRLKTVGNKIEKPLTKKSHEYPALWQKTN